MIPNIFVSSTVEDLRYLRDGLRDAIDELAYNPVLSEYGGVGYLNPSTAADSCVATVQQCQMMVLIIGKRYGNLSNNGLSITHNEMLKAREMRIPIITFVDAEVLAYKKIYEANRHIPVKEFPGMEDPPRTFQLIEEVVAAPFYNGLIAFGSVNDAKGWLKGQIANFVGDRLAEVISPIKVEIQDIRSDVKSLLHRLGDAQNRDAARFLKAMRFLLDDTNAHYRKLVEMLFGNIDVAVKNVMDAGTFDEVLERGGAKLEIVDLTEFRALIDSSRNANTESPVAGPMQAHWGSLNGSHAIFADRRVVMDPVAKRQFDGRQEQLRIQLDNEPF
jgi:Domain of unknown function (DUF4062)